MTEFLTSRFRITVSYDVMLDFYSPAFVYKALGYARHRTRTSSHTHHRTRTRLLTVFM
jgi:hypothetical protein